MDNGTERALKAWKTRRNRQAWTKAHASEAASKEALAACLKTRGWYLTFFEGSTGAPRTGIIDAIAYRLSRSNPDLLELRLIQLKGGNAGVTATEIARLKLAAQQVKVKWLIAAFDGKEVQFLPGGVE